ncbi:hypothetical protein JK635_08135 [Neobacillus sp. YIM B02564]|uniref:Uncharacterized protein n=1 Tax=Neobacillus paridis TaxID=2803862 RepID=A0ABS1TLL3_9BACI|nr:hypothetical protein [Neobacillus paridis]MBL4952180.1 hypothetical protein [Neobacillus paridis]
MGFGEVKKFENGLIVKSRKSAIILEADETKLNGYTKIFRFTEKEFQEFVAYIQLASSKVWKNVTPKEAQSEASDFYEYYDKELDNNGYLRIGESHLLINRPSLESNRMYQFNKRKMESFLYDLRKSAGGVAMNLEEIKKTDDS